MKRSLRQALTLVELLIVIAIIGILISLLLPAVQSAREAARRAQCQNKLMQFGLALQLYHQAHEALPSGVRDDAGPIRHEPKGKHYSWITQILPYVQQQNTHRKIDFSAGVYTQANLQVRGLGITLFACPSHRSEGPASDYAGCHHDADAPIDVDNHGVLFLNSAVRFDQISDGRSHTLFVGEKLTEEDAEKAMPEFYDYGAGPVPIQPGEAIEEPQPELQGEAATEALFPVNPAKPTDFGWMSGTRATLRNTGTPINQRRRLKPPSGLYNTMPEPAHDDAAAAALAAARLLHVGGFESHHAGGAQFVFGDGSVRFLSEQISSQVYLQLGHRADGKLLDDAGY